MSFGITGAHRSGKSTLAKSVSTHLNLPYFDGSFGRLAAKLDFGSAVVEMNALQRMEMQEKVLDQYLIELQESPHPFLTDRTPIDMIGYTLGERTMNEEIDPELDERICRYVDRCMIATTNHFDTIFILRPLTTYVEEPGKPPLNRAYQRCVQNLIEGALSQLDPELINVVPLDRQNFNWRMTNVVEFICGRMEMLQKERTANHAFLH